MYSVRTALLLLSCTAAFAQSQASIAQQRASVALQMEYIRKQAGAMPVAAMPVAAATAASDRDCDPLPIEKIAPMIESAAGAQGLQPSLLRAVIEQEAGFRPCAVSRKGAQGLMQLMPGTAEDLAVRDASDPKENIEAGARYLKQWMENYKGNRGRALGAYNAGLAVADKAGGIPNIPETRECVKSILQKIEPIR